VQFNTGLLAGLFAVVSPVLKGDGLMPMLGGECDGRRHGSCRQIQLMASAPAIEGPIKLLPNLALSIQHLIPQTGVIKGHLDTMQIFDAFWHSVSRACAGCADLQHASMHLNVERQDMAAQIRANAVLHEDVPERGTRDRLDVALILSRKAVDRE
jgi:hypothetical protein